MRKDHHLDHGESWNDKSSYKDDYSFEALINDYLTGTSEDNHLSRKSEDNHPVGKSKAIKLAIEIAVIIMWAIDRILDGKPVLFVVAVAMALCIILALFSMLKLKSKKSINLLLFFEVSILIIAVIVSNWKYIIPASDKETDVAIDTEQPQISDTLIMVDTSSHGMHEKEQELPPLIQISKISFLQCLQAAAQGEIEGAYYQKYKRGEDRQMFAIVEEAAEYEKTDEENLYGTIWYVDKYGAKEIDSEAKEYKWPYLFFLDDSTENVYLAYKEYRPEGSVVCVLGVDKTGPYHPIISGQGSNLHINKDEDEIEITTENGVYYFCVEGSFKEYGGLEISLAELLSIEDPQIENIVTLVLGDVCQINTIYYRENGIINITFSKEYETGEIRYFNITFRYDGEQFKIVPAISGQEYGEGIYLDALIPSIAVYPSEFPY